MNKLKNPLVIVANGHFPSHPVPLNVLNDSKCILACDGATNILVEKGYTPKVIIGDLDSISIKNKEKFSDILVEVKNQEENDFRKAIEYAKSNNIHDISIVGATGKREDHMIGNIFSLLKFPDLNIKLFTDSGVFRCIHSNQKIQSFKGQQVSLFTSDQTIKISTNNLKYNFNYDCISTLFYGCLNESIDNFFEIKISHGELLFFQTYK